MKMGLEAAHKKTLEYLLNYSPVNTFRLSRHLGIDRNELAEIIKDLTKRRLVRFKHGSVSIVETKYQKLLETEKQLKLSKKQPIPKTKETKEEKNLKEREKLLAQREEALKKREELIKKQKKKFYKAKISKKEIENIKSAVGELKKKIISWKKKYSK